MSKDYKFHIKKVNGKYSYYTRRYQIRNGKKDGKPETIVLIGKSKDEIYKKIAELEGRGENKNIRNNTTQTVCELVDYCLENQVKPFRTPNTYMAYKRYSMAYIKPYFCLEMLDDLTAEKTLNFYKYLREERNLCTESANHIYGFFSSCIDAAVKDGVFFTNPCKTTFKKPRIPHRRATPFTPEELAIFIPYIQEHSKYKYVYLTSLYLGTRRGETLGLSWDDYDKISGVIRIHQQVQNNTMPEGDRIILSKQTKNYSDETVGVPEEVQDYFEIIFAEQLEKKKLYGQKWKNYNNLIFTKKDGSMISPSTITKNFSDDCKAVGLKHRFHDLRHTCATAIFEGTGDIVHVKQALRDDDLRAVLRYVKTSNKMMKENSIGISYFIEQALQDANSFK